MADSEDQINLKKRARRRLVGAIALVTFIVIALPMVFDRESKPLSHDISVQIPSPEGSALQHRSALVPPPAVIPSLTAPAPAPSAAPPTTSLASPSAPAAAPAPAPVTKPAAPPAPPPAPTVIPPAKPPVLTSVPPKGAAKPPSAAVPAPAAAQAGAWVVKMGAFADASNVKRLQAQLTTAGFKSYTELYDSEQGQRTRVRAGPFPTRAAAEHARDKLKKLGLDGTVGEK